MNIWDTLILSPMINALLFIYTLLLLALVHKVAYQLEAFFRVSSTVLPMLLVAGLCLYPKATSPKREREPTGKRDRTLVSLVLMFEALLSVVGIPVLFLYLGSLPPAEFLGTPMHP